MSVSVAEFQLARQQLREALSGHKKDDQPVEPAAAQEPPPAEAQEAAPQDVEPETSAHVVGQQRPRRPAATHFLSLRVTTPTVLESVTEMQAVQCSADSAVAPYAVEPVRLHLTLMVLSLPTPEAVSRAAATFRASCEHAVSQHYPDGRCEVTFKGLGTFKEAVVFLGVAAGEAKERLLSFAAALAAPFHTGATALPPEFLIDSPFVPHATVYKLSNANRQRNSKRNQLRKLPGWLWASHESHLWGTSTFDSVQLNSMAGRKVGQYYPTVDGGVYTIPVPPVPSGSSDGALVVIKAAGPGERRASSFLPYPALPCPARPGPVLSFLPLARAEHSMCTWVAEWWCVGSCSRSGGGEAGIE